METFDQIHILHRKVVVMNYLHSFAKKILIVSVGKYNNYKPNTLHQTRGLSMSLNV